MIILHSAVGSGYRSDEMPIQFYALYPVVLTRVFLHRHSSTTFSVFSLLYYHYCRCLFVYLVCSSHLFPFLSVLSHCWCLSCALLTACLDYCTFTSPLSLSLSLSSTSSYSPSIPSCLHTTVKSVVLSINPRVILIKFIYSPLAAALFIKVRSSFIGVYFRCVLCVCSVFAFAYL
jgi:hypothetical protein